MYGGTKDKIKADLDNSKKTGTELNVYTKQGMSAHIHM